MRTNEVLHSISGELASDTMAIVTGKQNTMGAELWERIRDQSSVMYWAIEDDVGEFTSETERHPSRLAWRGVLWVGGKLQERRMVGQYFQRMWITEEGLQETNHYVVCVCRPACAQSDADLVQQTPVKFVEAYINREEFSSGAYTVFVLGQTEDELTGFEAVKITAHLRKPVVLVAELDNSEP